MQDFYSPEQLAALLKVDVEVIHRLVQSGQLRAYRIGGELRIGETDFANYLEQSVVTAIPSDRETVVGPVAQAPVLAASGDRSKDCPTFGGQSTFNYSGSISSGTTIWPSKKANYKLQFDAAQWELLLHTFRGREVRAGLNFSHPEKDSFGAWIKQYWNTKMSPAAYVGGILIAEGYASRPRPGWIKVFDQRRPLAAK